MMWCVVSSANGRPGIQKAAEVLRAGRSALDAVEVGICEVESNEADDSVGLGGIPNVLGQVELDASIMDGRTLAAGAVGALQGFEHPISVARQVMERSPHVMLVGDGAARFAAETGFPHRNLVTPKAAATWRKLLLNFLPGVEIDHITQRPALLPLVTDLQDWVRQHGTVNFLARDANGDIACGVSTSGWAWKYPGRLGDSPVIGAGNFADNRYGAAACCGYGELTIRTGTARSIVLYMKLGMSVHEACQEAVRDLYPLLRAQGGGVSILALDHTGCPFGVTTDPKCEPYNVMTAEFREPKSAEPLLLSIER